MSQPESGDGLAGLTRSHRAIEESRTAGFREALPEMVPRVRDRMPGPIPIKGTMTARKTIEASRARVVELFEAGQSHQDSPSE